MVYRDIKNSIDTARSEGEIEGKEEVAEILIKDGESNGKIMRCTGLTLEQLKQLRRNLKSF